MAVVTPLNNPGGPEGDTVTVVTQLLNTEYSTRLKSSNQVTLFAWKSRLSKGEEATTLAATSALSISSAGFHTFQILDRLILCSCRVCISVETTRATGNTDTILTVLSCGLLQTGGHVQS